MKTSTQKLLLIPAIIVIVALVVTYGVYLYEQSHAASIVVPVPVVTTAVPSSPTLGVTQVTIMVPNDLAAYEKAMNESTQVGGGTDPSKAFPFIAKTVIVSPTSDVVRASAEAAAEVIPTQAGTSSLVAYLKVVNGTAYVLLTMDIDGWAGVSTAIAKVHPLVERTLLTLPGINAVKFAPAPGDTLDSIMKSYMNQPATTSSTDSSDPVPVIISITPHSGPIGTIVELKGNNLAGFEGELDAWIVNSSGERAFLPGIGSVPRADQTIRVKIDSKLCKEDLSSKGGQCSSYLVITPGTYSIYTYPWGQMSNSVKFTITANLDINGYNPNMVQ